MAHMNGHEVFDVILMRQIDRPGEVLFDGKHSLPCGYKHIVNLICKHLHANRSEIDDTRVVKTYIIKSHVWEADGEGVYDKSPDTDAGINTAFLAFDGAAEFKTYRDSILGLG